jgi:hypothetical protein
MSHLRACGTEKASTSLPQISYVTIALRVVRIIDPRVGGPEKDPQIANPQICGLEIYGFAICGLGHQGNLQISDFRFNHHGTNLRICGLAHLRYLRICYCGIRHLRFVD